MIPLPPEVAVLIANYAGPRDTILSALGSGLQTANQLFHAILVADDVETLKVLVSGPQKKQFRKLLRRKTGLDDICKYDSEKILRWAHGTGILTLPPEYDRLAITHNAIKCISYIITSGYKLSIPAALLFLEKDNVDAFKVFIDQLPVLVDPNDTAFNHFYYSKNKWCYWKTRALTKNAVECYKYLMQVAPGLGDISLDTYIDMRRSYAKYANILKLAWDDVDSTGVSPYERCCCRLHNMLLN
jgi:hypothetical protein